jgi:hypothetical protein
MTDADPLDTGSPDRIGERIEGIADQAEYLLDADLFERPDQQIRNRS